VKSDLAHGGLLLLCALVGAAAATWTRDFADGVLGDAPDGVVTPAEIERVRVRGLGWLRFLADWAYSVDDVLRDCDANGDGFLSEADGRPAACMTTQFEVNNAVKYACRALARPGDRYFAQLHAAP